MTGRQSSSACEQHHNVQTGEFCPVCLVEDRDRLRDTLTYLVDIHHRTITMSRKHDPENQDWTDCSCKTCERVQEALR